MEHLQTYTSTHAAYHSRANRQGNVIRSNWIYVVWWIFFLQVFKDGARNICSSWFLKQKFTRCLHPPMVTLLSVTEMSKLLLKIHKGLISSYQQSQMALTINLWMDWHNESPIHMIFLAHYFTFYFWRRKVLRDSLIETDLCLNWVVLWYLIYIDILKYYTYLFSTYMTILRH